VRLALPDRRLGFDVLSRICAKQEIVTTCNTIKSKVVLVAIAVVIYTIAVLVIIKKSIIAREKV
jgi:hypothetical protein